MISYRWHPELDAEDRAQVGELVRVAADYDAEAGFTAIAPEAAGERSREGVRIAHLPIRARRDLSVHADAPWVPVAYLNLAIGPDGVGAVRYVVHPDYRSRGITTLLVEELGLRVSAAGGWAGTGARALRTWAYGTHPAAERLAARFGIAAIDRRWTLVRHLSGPWAVPLAEADVEGRFGPSLPAGDSAEAVELLTRTAPGSAELDGGRVIVARDETGLLGAVRFDPRPARYGELRAARLGAVAVVPRARGRGLGSALLTGALREMRDAGMQLALVRVGSADEGALRMLRLLSFEQEETHTRFAVHAT